jgi:hypothetical protein
MRNDIMEAENHKIQVEPSEGDRDTIDRELKRQDEKMEKEKADNTREPETVPKRD